MVELVDDQMDVERMTLDEDLPVSIDRRYNLIVCKSCGIGLPSEWVASHLRDQHGVTTTDEHIHEVLTLENEAMTLSEVQHWRESIWVAKAVADIPVIPGVRCDICHYSTGKKKVMKNHFSSAHKNSNRGNYTIDCNVQLVFGGRLRKYIQVEEDENMDVYGSEDGDWKRAIDMDFTESMANVKMSVTNEGGNLRLKNVFIAKTRWDSMMAGKDLKEVVRLTGAPTINDELRRIIVCGRRYIHNTCEALDKGSVIVKRLLMSGGYLNTIYVADYIGQRKRAVSLSLSKKKRRWMIMEPY
jgi:Orsellinic acid/F9775 biosynthesis cluster protein D